MKRHSIISVLLWLIIHHLNGQSINLVQNGSFENKESGINSDFKESSAWPGPGLYIFTTNVSAHGNQFKEPEGSSTGRYLVVDVGDSGKQRLWFDSIRVVPNTTYIFSCKIANVYYSTASAAFTGGTTRLPMVKLSVNGKKVSKMIMLSENSGWKILNGKFTSGPSQTMIETSIEDLEYDKMGNDVAIDDIFFGPFDPPEKKFPPEEKILPVVAKETAKKDTVKEETIETVVETVPVQEEEISMPDEEIVVAKIDPVKTENVISDKVIVEEKEEIKPDPVFTETKKTPVVTTEIKKTEPKRTIAVPTVSKKPAIVPVVAKKKQPALAAVMVKEKKEITAPEIRKKTIPPQVVVKKQQNIPLVVKKTPPAEEKKKETPVVAKKANTTSDFDKNMKKENIYVGQKLALKHIYFARSKYALLESSMPELNNLVEFMNLYPSIRIRLEGHTDNVGDPAKNVELSESRVKAVKKFLADHGIADNRIEWIGHGGSKALNDNATEEEKKKNRRVEVVIISK